MEPLLPVERDEGVVADGDGAGGKKKQLRDIYVLKIENKLHYVQHAAMI